MEKCAVQHQTLSEIKVSRFYTDSLSNSYETADTPRFVRPAGRPQSFAKFPQSYAEFQNISLRNFAIYFAELCGLKKVKRRTRVILS
ncbi:MAG: hypothetical protein BWK80_12840 [Desulfobacteraceae bacterium IS3]|nr:MAG: hypothetical protein BWK80_12840 [Desulfobacteraceae bacterium IS3]